MCDWHVVNFPGEIQDTNILTPEKEHMMDQKNNVGSYLQDQS